jgi:tetratricopeptide (TPR) repeat protein
MGNNELIQSFKSRMEEARLYFQQGLKEESSEILKEMLAELEASRLPENDKRGLRSQIKRELEVHSYNSLAGGGSASDSSGPSELRDPAQAFAYGLALMDGQFWEEAVQHFRQVAVVGHRVLEAWELCGDCAAQVEKWEEANRYYEILYSNPHVPDEIKQRILIKISRCSQALRKSLSKPSQPPARKPVVHLEEEVAKDSDLGAEKPESDPPAATAPLDHSLVSELLGREVRSWCNDKGACLTGSSYSYRIVNLLYVGMTSIVVELEREETGERFAGQSVKAPFNRSLKAEALARWTQAQLMLESPYLVKIFDLAHSDDMLFIVRENLPTSLSELLSKGEALPIPLAISLAYQVLEGLGDLHLHMGMDKEIRKLYHLDLRPSRILLYTDKVLLKINNGGLWREFELSNPDDTNIRKLPPAMLPYRAPEQFRPYLARRKPPVFTDVYLLGTIFYEMLTGAPAFHAASYEEYEIQHCDQYPTPPKVWRSEIPEDLSDLVMKCLENDPMKRWRSPTQLSLLLEKVLSRFITATKDDPYTKYMRRPKTL